MEGEQQGRAKKGGVRRRANESGQWDSELTVHLDDFYRYFTYYYPNKNKEEIISKCLTPNVFWITVDSLFYPPSVEAQAEKIALFRRKSTLKNGAYPPTKDALEEEKFILTLRKVVSFRQNTLDLEMIRETPLSTVLEYLGDWLVNHQLDVSRQLEQRYISLERENEQLDMELMRLGIPIVKASRLFSYEHLEREVINSSIEKATLKEREPRCDFCFTREKDILKCNTCAFHTHPACFPRLPKDPIPTSFSCDNCIRAIPVDAQCELCPSKGGHFLELSDDAPSKNYRMIRGETNLRFRISIEILNTRERRFIHVSCFVLHSECTYNVGSGLVEGLHLVDRNRKNMVNCSICGNMLGMTVPCNNENCRRSFHPECAKRHNLTISVIKANNKALLEIYCDRHKKPESYEYLKDSASNRIREVRKFYENVDYELKRGPHPSVKNKRAIKYEELIRQDKCLICAEENNFTAPITNCLKCYGWYHDRCSKVCANCDII